MNTNELKLDAIGNILTQSQHDEMFGVASADEVIEVLCNGGRNYYKKMYEEGMNHVSAIFLDENIVNNSWYIAKEKKYPYKRCELVLSRCDYNNQYEVQIVVYINCKGKVVLNLLPDHFQMMMKRFEKEKQNDLLMIC